MLWLVVFGIKLFLKLNSNFKKMKIHIYFVYILTNKNNTVYYTGITNNLARRCLEHKQKINKGFTNRYNVDKLIYYETFQYVIDAIRREKQIKGYSRMKKLALIMKSNFDLNELNP